jgi:hypothetical protein
MASNGMPPSGSVTASFVGMSSPADELSFARLIGFLLEDSGQRPADRAPSTAGGYNAEASRRYLLESRALDPQRQSLLLVLSGLELRGPRRAVATAAF